MHFIDTIQMPAVILELLDDVRITPVTDAIGVIDGEAGVNTNTVLDADHGFALDTGRQVP